MLNNLFFEGSEDALNFLFFGDDNVRTSYEEDKETATTTSYRQQHHVFFNDFQFEKHKSDGISPGDFYLDNANQTWLIKLGHFGSHKSVIKEYIAGGVYQYFLGEHAAPTIEIIIEPWKKDLLIGSKLLPNFSTLADTYFTVKNVYQNTYEYESNGRIDPPHFPHMFNGLPIVGFEKAITSILFVGDTDAHYGNVGLVSLDDHYVFAKIDHGFSFNFDNIYTPLLNTLDDIRTHLDDFYHFTDLSIIGFSPLLDAIKSISDIDFSQIENIIHEKIDNAQLAMDYVHFKYVNKQYFEQDYATNGTELSEYGAYLLDHLSDRQKMLKHIADHMELEEAIINHDALKIIDLHDQGVKLNDTFKPFFDEPFKIASPVYSDGYQEYHLHGTYTQSVDGMILLEKYWPEMYPSLSENYDKIESNALDIRDILTDRIGLESYFDCGNFAQRHNQTVTTDGPLATPHVVTEALNLEHVVTYANLGI